MTDIEGFLTIYGHSDNLLNNNGEYCAPRIVVGPGKLSGVSRNGPQITLIQ